MIKTASTQKDNVIQNLLTTSMEFKRLYEKHGELKRRVHEMQKGRFPDQQSLEEMKKKKLVLKDRLERFLRDIAETELSSP